MSEKRAETSGAMLAEDAYARKMPPVNYVTVRVTMDDVSVLDRKEILRYMGLNRYSEQSETRAPAEEDALNNMADSLLHLENGHVEAEYRVPNSFVDFDAYAKVTSVFGSIPVKIAAFKAGDEVLVPDDRSDIGYWNYVEAEISEGTVHAVKAGHMDPETKTVSDLFELPEDNRKTLQAVREAVELHIGDELEQGLADNGLALSQERLEDAKLLDASMQHDDEEEDMLYRR